MPQIQPAAAQRAFLHLKRGPDADLSPDRNFERMQVRVVQAIDTDCCELYASLDPMTALMHGFVTASRAG